jgi:protease IV
MHVHQPKRVGNVFLALGALGLLLLASCHRDRDSNAPKPKELRTIRLEQALPESPDRALLPASQLNHAGLIGKIAELAANPNVSGLLVQLSELGGSWGRTGDLRDALNDFRKAGKPVHCHVETTDSLGYALLASSCDHISMTPSGLLNLVGVSIDAVYAKKLLANLGLSADMIQAGRFKGAADPFTRDDMPPEVRQTLGAVVDDLQASLVEAVATGRTITPARVQALIDRGPFTAEDARAEGLLDDVFFDDAARATAKAAAKADKVVPEIPTKEQGPSSLLEWLSALWRQRGEEEISGPRLGLLYLDGTILRGSPSSIRSGHAEAFVRAAREFADQRDIRAIVLRIDSPGGSALASDLMWHAVRRAAKRKPVIVSIGDVCASGGYYVASAGTEIMAQDDSLIGSIGVVGGKVVVQDLAQRVGVTVVELARGKHAGWASPVRTWSSGERAAIERSLRSTYDRFISRIAEGRGLEPAQIEPYAEGRIMTSRRAREGKLVDRAGGLRAAIARARERGKLPGSAPLQVWPSRPTLMETLEELTEGGGQGSESRLGRAAIAALSETLPRHAMPGVLETLLAGEGAEATVMPFVLSLH